MDKKHNVNSIQTLYGQETQHIHHGNTIWTRNTTHTSWKHYLDKKHNTYIMETLFGQETQRTKCIQDRNTIHVWTRNTTYIAWKRYLDKTHNTYIRETLCGQETQHISMEILHGQILEHKKTFVGV